MHFWNIEGILWIFWFVGGIWWNNRKENLLFYDTVKLFPNFAQLVHAKLCLFIILVLVVTFTNDLLTEIWCSILSLLSSVEILTAISKCCSQSLCFQIFLPNIHHSMFRTYSYNCILQFYRSSSTVHTVANNKILPPSWITRFILKIPLFTNEVWSHIIYY